MNYYLMNIVYVPVKMPLPTKMTLQEAARTLADKQGDEKKAPTGFAKVGKVVVEQNKDTAKK